VYINQYVMPDQSHSHTQHEFGVDHFSTSHKPTRVLKDRIREGEGYRMKKLEEENNSFTSLPSSLFSLPYIRVFSLWADTLDWDRTIGLPA
jgi:hypothetical protein